MADSIITSAWDLVQELWGNAPYGNVWVKQRDGASRSTWFAISGATGGAAGALPLARFNAETARLAQRAGADVYFGVHPVARIPSAPGARSQLDVIHSARCLFGDFDRKDHAGIETNEELAAHIVAATWQAPPSVMVDTGGGIHAYWFLEQREDLTDVSARAGFAALQERWVQTIGADKGAKDLARVLRLPGARNQKYAPAPIVSIIDGNGIRYSLDVLRRMAAPAPTIIDVGSARHVAATTATTPAEDRTDGHADAPQTAPDAPRRAEARKPTTTAATPAAPLLGADDTPSAYYNANHGPDALALLFSAGWVIDREDADGALYLTRPGKDDGVSASWGKAAPNVLYVFSSNAHPFEAGRSYDAFGVFAHVVYGGNFGEAARTIRQTMMPAPPSAPTRQGAIARDAVGRPLEARIESAPAPRFRAMTVAELIAAGADRIAWIVPNMIAPRMITVIAGKGQSGKSLLMLRAAIEIAQHHRVMWWALEAAGEIAGRAAVIDAELRSRGNVIEMGQLGIISTQYENGNVINEPLDVTKPASVEAWGRWIRAQSFRVVIIDAWVNLLGHAGLDENSTADASRAVAALDQIMNIADCAVVVIAHSAKAPNGMGDAVRGSSVLTNSARVVIAMANDDGDVTARTVKANNQKPFNEIRLDITAVEHDGRSGPMIDRRTKGRPARTTITTKHLRVLQTIGALDEGQGVTIKDIADALQADMSRQVATPIVKALTEWGHVVTEKKTNGKGSVYSLSTQGRAAVAAADDGIDVTADIAQQPALTGPSASALFRVEAPTARHFDGPMGQHADQIDELAAYSAPTLVAATTTTTPAAPPLVAATTATTPAEDRTDGHHGHADAGSATVATTPAEDRSDADAGSADPLDVAPIPSAPRPSAAEIDTWRADGADTAWSNWWRRHARADRADAAPPTRLITIRRGVAPSGVVAFLVCDGSCFGLLRGTNLDGYQTEAAARAAAEALGVTPTPIVSSVALEIADWYAPAP